MTADQWLTSLQAQVAAQAASTHAGDGFFSAFPSPMTITGSARIYSLFTSQAVFNGQVIIKISTDGKFMITGKLNFADNNVSISGRLYADLSRVSEGNVTVLFLADIPDQVRLLTIYGKIKMGFRDSSGQDVTFDVVDPAADSGASASPTVGLVAPTTDGSAVDVNTYNGTAGSTKYVDLNYKAGAGGTLDVAAILGTTPPFTVKTGGTATPDSGTLLTITGAPTPIVAITTDSGVTLVALQHDSTTHDIYYQTNPSDSSTKVVVIHASDFSGASDTDLMVKAIDKIGTSRFRYSLGTSDLPLGVVRLKFNAGAFKNADVTTTSGTVTGASNAETTLTFNIQGATGNLIDPGAGGSVDVNTINDRNWIDVSFTAASSRTIDAASITDLDPEFTLTGSGVGSIQLDASRAPTMLPGSNLAGTATFRYWLTGNFTAAGDVTLTYLPRSWSFTGGFLTGSLTAATLTHGTTPGTLTLTLPSAGVNGVPTGYQLDPHSVTFGSFTFTDAVTDDSAHPETLGIQLTNSGWTITIDQSRPIQQVGNTNQFLIPIIVNTASSTNDATFTIPLVAGATSYTAQESTGTQSGTTVTTPTACGTSNVAAQCAVTVPGNNRTFVDVHFSPSGGSTFDVGAISGDELSFGGFGGTGIAMFPTNPVVDLGGGNYRFLLQGDFRPGAVTVTFLANTFHDNSPRAPPYSIDIVQNFSVNGATADLVRTVPATATDPEKVVALGGSTVGLDLINSLHYIEVRFRPTAGNAIDSSSINGDELQLRDSAGNVITLSAPVRVGLTDTYRYGFTGALTAGSYTVTFVAGSFRDNAPNGGNANQTETETFALASPSSALGDPGTGQVLNVGDFNGRGYVDVTFASFGGTAVDPATILDSGAEITITTDSGLTLTVDGTPILVNAATGTYRYFFTGHTSGSLIIAYVANGWANTAGTQWTSALSSAVSHEDVSNVQALLDRTWLDVVYKPVAGTKVDPLTVTGNEITLTGAGAEALTSNGVVQVDDTTFRYLYGGQLTPGTVNVAFVAGGWSDTDHNASVADASSFRLITPAQSFYIEISGGITLSALGLLDEPLVDLKAEVTLEIDTNRGLFTLTFDGQLSIIKLGTVGSTSGRFVLDTGNGLSTVPQFWGVATLETNFSALETYGLFLFAKGTLQINTTDAAKTEVITLKGIGAGGTDVTRTFNLAPRSFSLELVGQARIRPNGTTSDLVRLQGGFFLSIDASANPRFELYATAELSFGLGDAQLTYGSATGLIIIDSSGIAGMLNVSAGGSVGLPNVGTAFSVTGSVSVMFNTTLHDKTFQIPDDFLPLLHPGDPTTLTIFSAAPGLDGHRNPNAPPGGEVYVKATIAAQITIGGVLTLNGFIGLTAAVDTGGNAYLKVDGAVGTQIAFLGSLTGVLNLAVYVGATRTGVVGRIQLTLGSSSIPGIVLNGQFLLELNTFTSQQTIQTFAIQKKTLSSGVTVFDGFQRDGAGNLVVTTQTLDVVAGFKLEMSGLLIIGDRLRVQGSVEFKIELAGASPGIELVVNGSIAL